MSITEALSKIQKELNAPKSQYNSFGNYRYRNCEDILAAVKPLLDDGTITLTDDIVMVGNRIYVKAIATFTKGNDSISVSAFAREPEDKKGMDASQITGAASSYARKYALNGLLCIDDNKDADHPVEPVKATPKETVTARNGNGNGKAKSASNDPMETWSVPVAPVAPPKPPALNMKKVLDPDDKLGDFKAMQYEKQEPDF